MTRSHTWSRSCVASVKPTGRSSLENNLIVTEILDAARESAESGRTVTLAPEATPQR